MAIVNRTSGSDVITPVFTSIGVSGQPTAVSDQIDAGAGDDFISGGAGNDSINGGSGIDTVAYSDASAGIDVSLATGLVSGGAGNDTLSSIENAIGSGFADAITGSSGSNSLRGDGGNDTFIGTAGNDTLNGGAGSDDAANYSLIGAAVTLSAQGALNKGTALGTDTLIGIERIIGSNLLGDTVDLSGAIAPATSTTANLTSGLISINGASGVLLINGTPLSFSVSQFENVTGSSLADTITGSSGVNTLSGGDGNDFISGGLGSDFITGNAGKDTLLGGADNDIDTFAFTSFSDSLLANFDTIGDFTGFNIIDRPGQLDASLNTSNGIAAGLLASQVSAILNNFSFTANSTRAFTAIGFSGTLVAFNDGAAGFNEFSDSIVHLPSFNLGGTNTIAIA